MSEELEQEIEVLRAIYQDELSGSASSGLILDVRPTPGSLEHCELKLTFTIPPKYPQVVPTVTVTPVKGVTPDEISKLLALLKERAEENIGQQMVFTLASSAKEWLDDLNTHYDERHKKDEALEAVKAAAAEEAAEKEREKARGTLVTRETFLTWNTRFLEEQRQAQITAASAAAAVALASGAVQKEKKLTGRQLFEADASLVMSDAAFLAQFNEQLEPASPSLLADPTSAALFDDADLLDNDSAPPPDEDELEAASS
jgi:hypothetical protein